MQVLGDMWISSSCLGNSLHWLQWLQLVTTGSGSVHHCEAQHCERAHGRVASAPMDALLLITEIVAVLLGAGHGSALSGKMSGHTV